MMGTWYLRFAAYQRALWAHAASSSNIFFASLPLLHPSTSTRTVLFHVPTPCATCPQAVKADSTNLQNAAIVAALHTMPGLADVLLHGRRGLALRTPPPRLTRNRCRPDGHCGLNVDSRKTRLGEPGRLTQVCSKMRAHSCPICRLDCTKPCAGWTEKFFVSEISVVRLAYRTGTTRTHYRAGSFQHWNNR